MRVSRFGLASVAGLLILSAVAWFLFRSGSRQLLEERLASTADEFFSAYWRLPVPPQGPPPASFTAKEASLRPEDCGSCHRTQYLDWKESLHAKAMGPGPLGQILDLTRSNPGEALLCASCHAPLSEQSPFLPGKAGSTEGRLASNPDFDPELRLQGITCAACHVRAHRRFGPPKDPAAAPYPSGMPNHGGARRTPFFERAQFCKECHQFDPDDTVLVNGKPLQDTYREWKRSFWAEGGAACQDCHMPNRRHLWRGIHDPEWVKNGVRIDARLEESGRGRGGAETGLIVEVANTGVGHKFPTYVTPKVFVRAVLLDARGHPLLGTRRERMIGWDARFEEDGWKEYSDTRIAPGEKFTARFRWARAASARKIRAWVEVHPDHFYHVHFYPAYLRRDDLSPEGRRLVQQALADSGKTPYTLFEKVIPLPR
jgi:hypothetical protein